MQSRHRFQSACWLCLAAVLLAAVSCRDAEERTRPAPPPADSLAGHASADHSPGDSPPAEAPASIDEVVYEVSGGFAGFQLELRIQRGGEAAVYDAGKLVRRGRLTDDQWTELKHLVADAHLRELAGEHGHDDGSVADAMREVVSVRSGAETVSVATAGGPEGPLSDAFVRLTRRLMELALTLPPASSGAPESGDRR